MLTYQNPARFSEKYRGISPFKNIFVSLQREEIKYPMDDIVQWATILSPIIAILIAVWTIRKSAKDTARHIKSVEESTRLQVESIKELSQIQLETTLMQIDKELRDNKIRLSQASGRMFELSQMNSFRINMNGGIEYQRKIDEEKRQLSDEIDYLEDAIDTLNSLRKRLVTTSNQL